RVPGVVAGRERNSSPQALAPHEPADRAFGEYVHGVGREFIERISDRIPPRQGHLDLRIPWIRPAQKIGRADDPDLGSVVGKQLEDVVDGGDNAIDLRMPTI